MRTYKNLLFALVFTALFPLASQAQDGKKHDAFTGEIHFEMNAEGAMASMVGGQLPKSQVSYISDDKMMVSQKGSVMMGDMDIIMDAENEKVYTVMHKKKMISKTDASEEDDKKKKDQKFKKKGKGDAVLGYKTTKYELTTKHPTLGSDVITTVLATEDIEPAFQNEKMAEKMKKAGVDGFILKTSVNLMGGQIITHTTATEIVPKQMDDAQFALPEGYEETDKSMEEIMGGKQ